MTLLRPLDASETHISASYGWRLRAHVLADALEEIASRDSGAVEDKKTAVDALLRYWRTAPRR